MAIPVYLSLVFGLNACQNQKEVDLILTNHQEQETGELTFKSFLKDMPYDCKSLNNEPPTCEESIRTKLHSVELLYTDNDEYNTGAEFKGIIMKNAIHGDQFACFLDKSQSDLAIRNNTLFIVTKSLKNNCGGYTSLQAIYNSKSNSIEALGVKSFRTPLMTLKLLRDQLDKMPEVTVGGTKLTSKNEIERFFVNICRSNGYTPSTIKNLNSSVTIHDYLNGLERTKQCDWQID
ncbi:MAG: hypothetical protein WBA74_02190 [Cyclobacteriaceae bacterium]